MSPRTRAAKLAGSFPVTYFKVAPACALNESRDLCARCQAYSSRGVRGAKALLNKGYLHICQLTVPRLQRDSSPSLAGFIMKKMRDGNPTTTNASQPAETKSENVLFKDSRVKYIKSESTIAHWFLRFHLQRKLNDVSSGWEEAAVGVESPREVKQLTLIKPNTLHNSPPTSKKSLHRTVCMCAWKPGGGERHLALGIIQGILSSAANFGVCWLPARFNSPSQLRSDSRHGAHC